MSVAVVGTGTGIGKTVVTAGLTGWLRAVDIDAVAVKPAQTGHPPDDDAAFVAAACGDPDAAVCLRRLGPPLAPRAAAAEDGETLAYGPLLDDCRSAIAATETAVVEGIGGLRVPLAGDREVADLFADLGLPAVVVAAAGLGTLNHTALTVEALDRRDVPVHAVILNEYEGATLAERTNPAELSRMTGLDVYTVPPLELDRPADAVAGVRAHLPAAVFPPASRP